MTQAPERILWAAAFSFGLAADLTEAMANGGQGKSPPVIKIRPAATEPAKPHSQTAPPKAAGKRSAILCVAGCDDEDPLVVYARKIPPLENPQRQSQWSQMSQALWCQDSGGCTSHYGLPLWGSSYYYYWPYAYPVYSHYWRRHWHD